MNTLAINDNAMKAYLSALHSYSKSDIPTEVVNVLAKSLVIEEYVRGELYCRQHLPTNKTGLLVKGSAKATTDELDNGAQVMKFFIPGDFLSADNVQATNLSDRNIIFTANSTVITHYNIKEFLSGITTAFPAMNNILVNMYMEEIEKIRKISTMRSITKAKERVQYYYMHFGYFDNHFSGKDIAGFIGVQRETFSRNRLHVLKSNHK